MFCDKRIHIANKNNDNFFRRWSNYELILGPGVVTFPTICLIVDVGRLQITADIFQRFPLTTLKKQWGTLLINDVQSNIAVNPRDLVSLSFYGRNEDRFRCAAAATTPRRPTKAMRHSVSSGVNY